VVRKNNLEYDVLLGLKFVKFSANLESAFVGIQSISSKLERLWLDPVIDTNFTCRPHKRIELIALADIGAPVLDE
jgi:hypothetical protein